MHFRLPCSVLLTSVFLFSALSVSGAEVWYTDLDQARRIATESSRPILCHFGAEWCGPCQLMERQVFPQRIVQDSLSRVVVAVKIDINEKPELAKRFGITQFPTDLFLEPNGTEIMKTTGYKQVGEYVALMTRAKTRYDDLVVMRAKAEPPANEPLVAGKVNNMILPVVAHEVMMDGYCPVTLWKTRRWVKGSPRLHLEFQGQTYTFSGQTELEEFQQSPERYVPQFLGCDAVIAWESNRAVPGQTQYGAFYNEQLYLFTSDENRVKFKSAPDRFVQTQVVLKVDEIEKIVK